MIKEDIFFHYICCFLEANWPRANQSVFNLNNDAPSQSTDQRWLFEYRFIHEQLLKLYIIEWMNLNGKKTFRQQTNTIFLKKDYYTKKNVFLSFWWQLAYESIKIIFQASQEE